MPCLPDCLLQTLSLSLAVKTFQSRNKLESDGDVDVATMEVLLSNDAKKAENFATPKPTSKTTPKPSGKTTPKPSGKTTPKPTSSNDDSGDSGGTSGHTITYGLGVETFIQIAESKLGCKYVRGAKGPNRFDCSGFVYWCLNQAGVKQSYMTSKTWRTCTKYKRITSMEQVSRGSAGECQSDERAGVARLRWRVSSK